MTARYLAVKALVRQEQNGYANLVLDAELKKCTPPLDARDTAFAASIFYTALERQNTLDFCLSQFSRKPVAKLDAPVRAILRAGLAQATYLRVPLPAAVNESVKLARAFGKTSAAGMVNAILRRAAAFEPEKAAFASPPERLSVLGNLSPQIADLFYAQYGEDAFALAEAFYSRQPTAIRVNTLKTTSEKLTPALTQEKCVVTPGPLPNCLQVEFPASPAATRAFAHGFYHVQGVPSQLAALSLAPRPGERVLDLCAAPGGKSLTLAEQMENRGELLSCDVVPGRLPLIEKLLARCGVSCGKTRQMDAGAPDGALCGYDRILCDVPCSGLGVIGKKPDIRYKTLAGLDELVALQARILQNAAGYLAQNGRLVYSTCTVNFSENEGQVRNFLERNKNFHVVPIKFELPGAVQSKYGASFLPHKTGTDGFFIAVLEHIQK